QFWLTDPLGQVLLRRRPPSGLLGGMLELPGAPWRPEPWSEPDAMAHAPQPAAWRLMGQAAHGFTHFTLTMDVYAAQVPRITAGGLLHDADALGGIALPTAMRRCVTVASAGLHGRTEPGATPIDRDTE
ncbi:MAG: NUDIX domain-containing protein, partial [Gemmatimonadaceae bacterium]|nr:NUDIX domain-containing protein [Acetobacteraceae bacterium]